MIDKDKLKRILSWSLCCGLLLATGCQTIAGPIQPSTQQQDSPPTPRPATSRPTITQPDSHQRISLPTPPPSANWSPDGRYYAVADGGNLAVVDAGQERVWQQPSATHFWRWTADSRFAIFSYAHPHGNRLTTVFDTAAWDLLLETAGCDVVQGGSLIVFDQCGEAPVALSPVSARFLMENGRLIELPGLEQTDLLAGVDKATIAREGGPDSPVLAGWSPDGRYLAFVISRPGPNPQHYTLYIARGDGSHLQSVASLSPFPRRLEWATDGQTVIVKTGAGKQSGQKYLVEAVSGVVHMASTATLLDLSSQVQGPIQTVAAADDYLYLNICDAFVVLNLTDPVEPVPVGLHWLAEKTSRCVYGEYVSDLFVLDEYAYVANYEAGLHLIDVTDPAVPQEVGRYRPPRLGWNDFPNIPSPEPPRYLYREGARGVVAHQGSGGKTYAYVAAYAAGLRVVDVTNPAAPVEVGALEFELPAAPVALTVQGDYAYIAAGKGGLRLVDISDPTAPVEVGHSPAEEFHWSRDVTLASIDGRTVAYLSEDGCQDVRGCFGGLRSVDVSDPTAPHKIRFSRENPWFNMATVDNTVYYSGAGGMKIINPKTGLVAATVPDLGFGDMAGVPGYLYQAAGKLRILDASDPLAPAVISTMFPYP